MRKGLEEVGREKETDVEEEEVRWFVEAEDAREKRGSVREIGRRYGKAGQSREGGGKEEPSGRLVWGA